MPDQVPDPPQDKAKAFIQNWWLIATLAVLGAVGVSLGTTVFRGQIRFLSAKDLDIVRALTPLAIAAIFIERAVEMLISPWREATADEKAQAVKSATAAAVAAATPPQADQDVQESINDLNDYKGETKKVAFLLAFALSLIASLAGVRSLGPFLPDDGLKALSGSQQHLFWAYDVLLTSALLPGGADLVHSIFSAINSVFNKVSKSANS